MGGRFLGTIGRVGGNPIWPLSWVRAASSVRLPTGQIQRSLRPAFRAARRQIASAAAVCLGGLCFVSPCAGAPPESPASFGTTDSAEPAALEPRLRLTGDFRLRYQRTTLPFDAPTQNLGVLRGRLLASYRLTDTLDLGGRIGTGDPENPRTNDVTLGDFAHKLDLTLDRAYLALKARRLTLLGGRFANPFFTSELVWDGDVNPQGLAASVDLPELGCVAPRLTGMAFLISAQTAGDDSHMLGVQASGRCPMGRSWEATAALSYLDHHLTGISAGDVRGNRLTEDRSAYLSDFDLVDLLGQLTFRGLGPRWPVSLTLHFVHNAGAALADDSGFNVELRVGSGQARGAMVAQYAYARVDRDAVLAAFSHDNIPLATNHRVHTVASDWFFRANVFTTLTLYLYRPLVPADPEPFDGSWRSRVRLNVTALF